MKPKASFIDKVKKFRVVYETIDGKRGDTTVRAANAAMAYLMARQMNIPATAKLISAEEVR